MSKINKNYLFQYSATGALFYVYYENGREKFYVMDTLLPPGEVQIKTNTGMVYGKCNLWKQRYEFERIIKDSAGQPVASLVRKKENEYLLRDAEGKLRLCRDENCYYGESGKERIFFAQKIENLQDLCTDYHRKSYDLTYGYELFFYKPLTENRKIWMGSFPMLRM